MRTLFLIFGLLSGAATISGAQENNDEETTSSENAAQPMEYAAALRQYYFQSVLAYIADPESKASRSGNSQWLSAVGREDLRVEPEDYETRFSNVLSDDPIPFLVKEALSTSNIVIINESHARPDHRAFIAQLIEALAQEGWTHYAAETFFRSVADWSLPYAAAIGTYSNEPGFAMAIEAALQNGMKLVAYEQTSEQRAPSDAEILDQMIVRDEAQAENLIEAVLGAAPTTNIIIHVGYNHVAEVPLNTYEVPVEWMAARLKRKTGIDPLTISLTHAASPLAIPVVGNKITDEDGADVDLVADLVVGIPKLMFRANRPVWRRTNGARDVALIDVLKGFDEPIIIEARQRDRDANAVPDDRLMVFPGEDIPLILKPGRYGIDAYGQSNQEPVYSGVLSIKEDGRVHWN